VKRIDDCALTIVLHAPNIDVELARKRRNLGVDIGEPFASVYLRFAFAEQI
jgi:hypothetical protein